MAQPGSTGEYGVAYRIGADTTDLRQGFAEAERSQEQFARSTENASQKIVSEYQKIADEMNIVIERASFLRRVLEDLGEFARFGIPAAGIGGLIVLAGQLRTVANIVDFISNRRISRAVSNIFGGLTNHLADMGDEIRFNNEAMSDFRIFARDAFREFDPATRRLSRLSSILRRIASMSFNIAVNWADIGTIVGTVSHTLSQRLFTSFQNVGSFSVLLRGAVASLNAFTRANISALGAVRSSLGNILDIASTLFLAFGTRGAGLAARVGATLSRSIANIGTILSRGFRSTIGVVQRNSPLLLASAAFGAGGLGIDALLNSIDFSESVSDATSRGIEDGAEEGFTSVRRNFNFREALDLYRIDESTARDIANVFNESVASGVSEGVNEGVAEASLDFIVPSRIQNIGRQIGEALGEDFGSRYGRFARESFVDAWEGADGRFVLGVPGGTGIGTGTQGVITRVFTPQETARRVNLAVFGSATPFADAATFIGRQIENFYSLFDIFGLGLNIVIPDFTASIRSMTEALGEFSDTTLDAIGHVTGLSDALAFAGEVSDAVEDLVDIFTLPQLLVGNRTGIRQFFGAPLDIEESIQRLLENIRAEYAFLRQYFESFLQEQDQISARERLTQQINDPRGRFAQAEENLAVRYARKRDEEIRRLEAQRISELQAEFFPEGIQTLRQSIDAAREGARDRFAQATPDFQARAREDRTARLIEEFFPRGVDAVRRDAAAEDPRARFAQATPDFLARSLREQEAEQQRVLDEYAERLTENLSRGLGFSIERSFDRFLIGRDAGDFSKLGENLLDGITSNILRSTSRSVVERVLGPAINAFTSAIFLNFNKSLTNLGTQLGELVAGLFSGIGGGGGGGLFAGIGRLLGFQGGGIVPGRMGEPQLVVAHGGEHIFNESQIQALGRGGGDEVIVNINITGDISRQTRTEVLNLIPEIGSALSSNRYERGLGF